MSLDTEFSRVIFPAIPSGQQNALDARARAGGHAAGYAAGVRAASEEIAAHRSQLDAEHYASTLHNAARVDRVVALLAEAASALDSLVLPVLAEAQDAVAASAIDLAEAILGSELRNEARSAHAAVARALADVDRSIVYTVRMNPLDLEMIGEATRSAAGVNFTADSTMARGDAITELPDGYLDARIAVAVARARSAILAEA